MQTARRLKFFFDEKKKIRSGYSMRALARDLSLSPSYVSEVFSGKKRLAPDALDVWVKALGVDAQGRRELEESLMREMFATPSPAAKRENWELVGSEDQDLLRKWFYVVVLDLAGCESFRGDAASVASRIGIKEVEAREALSLLAKRGYLAEKDGLFRKTRKKLRFPTSRSIEVVRNYHRQMIQLAAQELLTRTDAKSFENRLISGITFAGNPAAMPRAKQRLSEVLHEIAEMLMEGPCTEVYQLNVQLFSHLIR